MSVSVRQLTPNDAALAAALKLEYARNTYVALLPPERLGRLTPGDALSQCRRLLRDPADHSLFAAFMDGEPAGIAAAGRLRWRKNVPPGYTGELHTFYVVPKFRRRFGIADKLWASRVAWLLGQGMERAVAFVLEKNRSGRAHVERRGGRIIATKRGDRLWAGHTLLIYGWDELSPPRC